MEMRSNMPKLLGSVLILAFTAGAIEAAEIRRCADAETSVVFIAEPWEANTRRFANGDVRLAILDLIEPAAGAFHLLVLSPPFGDLGLPTCQVVSFHNATGYTAMSFDGMQSTYDPKQGFLFEIPMAVGPEPYNQGALFVTLDQSTGLITAEDIGS